MFASHCLFTLIAPSVLSNDIMHVWHVMNDLVASYSLVHDMTRFYESKSHNLTVVTDKKYCLI